MAKPPPQEEQEPTDLVAYLDGELSGAAAQVVERKIARSGAVRAEAAALKQTWDLLDLLPQPQPSPSFTNRTLERLAPPRTAAAAVMPIDRPWTWPWRVGAMGGWAASLVAAVFIGFYGFNYLHPPVPKKAESPRENQITETKPAPEHPDTSEEADEQQWIRTLPAHERDRLAKLSRKDRLAEYERHKKGKSKAPAPNPPPTN